jgi:hypothetical protein
MKKKKKKMLLSGTAEDNFSRLQKSKMTLLPKIAMEELSKRSRKRKSTKTSR